MEAMEKRVAQFDVEEFYFLARTALVKDERHLDRFDRVFGHCFKGVETASDLYTKLALRRVRQFAREGAAEELDLDGTVRSTAHNAGWLDLRLVPERHNAVKLLLFVDVGGSMEDHVRVCEELFSTARSEFRHLVHFYFHNCLYDAVWRDSRRRQVEQVPVMEIIRT